MFHYIYLHFLTNFIINNTLPKGQDLPPAFPEKFLQKNTIPAFPAETIEKIIDESRKKHYNI